MRRLLMLFAGLAGLVGAGRPALAQIDIKSMAMMDGQCRAEIGGQAVSCTPSGTFVQFGNGRSLFAFSRERVLYSFSGSRVQQRGANSFALIVDMIRIASEKAPDRDLGDSRGECLVQTAANGEPFTAIACDGHSPGQNARYRFSLDRISNFEREAYR
ncbi:MAG TPA: hypothetical protein VFB13_07975 [Reyranella sp.]|nr:hypothetical protein [Reyranella sp.]